jgi:branched-chain amino acid transport system substrate-binding protein
MIRNKTFMLVLVALLVLSTSCQAAGSSGDQELVIGAAIALTGANAPFDSPFKEGLEVAVQRINDAGGIDGRIPIRLEIRDIKSDAALASQVAQELVGLGVDVMITGADTDYCIASGLVAKAAGIPAIASVATTPTIIAAVGDNMFLASMGDNTQSAALAEYAIGQGYQTAYTLGSPDSAYTQKVIEYFTAAYTNLGGEIVLADTFSVGATDFAAQIAKIQALNPQPDVIVTSAWVPDSAVFVKQLRASGIDTQVLSTDGNDSPLLMEVGGDAVEGMIFSTHGFLAPGSALEQFYADYEEIKGQPPESIFAALAGDLIAAVEAAVIKAGSTDPAAIRDALDSLADVQGVTGTMTYAGQRGVPLKDVALVVVQDGSFELLSALQPSEVPAP